MVQTCNARFSGRSGGFSLGSAVLLTVALALLGGCAWLDPEKHTKVPVPREIRQALPETPREVALKDLPGLKEQYQEVLAEKAAKAQEETEAKLRESERLKAAKAAEAERVRAAAETTVRTVSRRVGAQIRALQDQLADQVAEAQVGAEIELAGVAAAVDAVDREANERIARLNAQVAELRRTGEAGLRQLQTAQARGEAEAAQIRALTNGVLDAFAPALAQSVPGLGGAVTLGLGLLTGWRMLPRRQEAELASENKALAERLKREAEQAYDQGASDARRHMREGSLLLNAGSPLAAIRPANAPAPVATTAASSAA
ncbi:MAG: hypothetical protein IOD15_11255 [Phycisphaerales bacterium]|nr:hypothetical protein [Phycisphaerales bacterium]